MDEVALKACPFCGSGAIIACVTSGPSDALMVACGFCYTRGPRKDTEAEAIAAWNTRPSQPGEESALSDGLPPFEQAWARYTEKGYRYGRDALENVAFGYRIAREELSRRTPVEAVPDEVERVARAICVAMGENPDEEYAWRFNLTRKPTWQKYESAARAALSSIPALPSERAQIVAWLRGQCRDPMLSQFAEFLGEYANAIERGDHLPAPPQATDQMEVG
jgi:Lar family restriction alleviation protein